MAKGILYGVGVGPGDPELLTLKAVRILRESDIIAVPDKGTGRKIAMSIAGEIIGSKELLYCPTPMIKDRQKLDTCYDRIALDICSLLSEGKQVAFITLGDPSIYSTYIYVHSRVLERGFTAEMVPGVTSFCAAAAKLNMSLCKGAERLLIVPAGHGSDDTMDVRANKVFMKAGNAIGELIGKLSEGRLLEKTSMVVNCGMDGESVFTNLAEAEVAAGAAEAPGYFAIVVTRED